MRKEAHYDMLWSEIIVNEWLEKHARASEIWLAVSGFNTHEIAKFLQKNSNFWQIVKDIVNTLERRLLSHSFEAVLSHAHYYTTQMYSPNRLADCHNDEKLLESRLTDFRSWLSIETRGFMGGCSQTSRRRGKKNRPYSSPKEFYVR